MNAPNGKAPLRSDRRSRFTDFGVRTRIHDGSEFVVRVYTVCVGCVHRCVCGAAVKTPQHACAWTVRARCLERAPTSGRSLSGWSISFRNLSCMQCLGCSCWMLGRCMQIGEACAHPVRARGRGFTHACVQGVREAPAVSLTYRDL